MNFHIEAKNLTKDCNEIFGIRLRIQLAYWIFYSVFLILLHTEFNTKTKRPCGMRCYHELNYLMNQKSNDERES